MGYGIRVRHDQIIRLHLPVRPVSLFPMRTTSILYALMFLYVALRVVWPLRLRWWWRGLLGVPLALGAWKFSIPDYLYPDGCFFAPEADAAVLLPLTALNVFLILFSLLLLVAELRAPLGVYGVIGNHDYPSGYQAWLRFLRSCGIRMLVNEHAPLGDALTMAGVNDPMAEWNHEEAPNLPKALAGAPADRPVVLLAHEPVFADTAAKDKRVALQLSGHTHGGLFPGLSVLVARYNGGYVKGLYRVGSMPLYVSPGTSLWAGMPVRLFCPAEITLITLRPRPGRAKL